MSEMTDPDPSTRTDQASGAEHPALLEVRVSVPDAPTGRRIAHDLVARQLAACVQVMGPITSVYSWKGEVEQEDEWLLLIKSTEDAFAELAATVRGVHRYDVPEIIAVPVTHALAEYADWVRRRSDGITDDELLEP